MGKKETEDALLTAILEAVKTKGNALLVKGFENVNELTCYKIKGNKPEETKFALNVQGVSYVPAPYDDNTIIVAKDKKILEVCKKTNRKIKKEKGCYYQEVGADSLENFIAGGGGEIIEFKGLTEKEGEKLLKKCGTILPNFPVGVSRDEKTTIKIPVAMLSPKTSEQLAKAVLETMIDEHGVKSSLSPEHVTFEEYEMTLAETRFVNSLDDALNEAAYAKDGTSLVTDYLEIAKEWLEEGSFPEKAAKELKEAKIPPVFLAAAAERLAAITIQERPARILDREREEEIGD